MMQKIVFNVIYIDFQKIFDVLQEDCYVKEKLMLLVLEYAAGWLNNWVILNWKTFKFLRISNGVQDTGLSPILSIMYMNDIELGLTTLWWYKSGKWNNIWEWR